MNTNNFKIENNGIISILPKGRMRQNIIKRIIESNKDKKIMLWQNWDIYYPCERLHLNLMTDLKALILDSSDFDLLIIDCFVEWCNTSETIEFLKYIKKSNYIKNKKIVIFFNTRKEKSETGNNISLNDFKVYKDIILEISNEIYLFNKKEDFFIYKLQDKEGAILSYWDCRGYNTLYRVDLVDKSKFILSTELYSFLKYELFFSFSNIKYFVDEKNLILTKELQDLANYFEEKDFKVAIINAESLCNEYLDSISKKIDKNDLIDNYQEYEALIIYDLQFLQQKDNCAEYVYKLIEAFYKSDRKIILLSTCDINDKTKEFLDNFYTNIEKYIVE